MAKSQTNLPDWSSLIPVLPRGGPRGRALQEELRRLIETRVLLPGQKLPPSRDLAQRLSLARGAVVAAYDQLAADGYVETRQGAGTYVGALVPASAPVSPAITLTKSRQAGFHHDAPAPGKLGSGTVDEKTLRDLRNLFRHALARPPASFIHYGDPFGEFALRHEIVSYLRATRGIQAEVDQVMVTSGTQSALDVITRAVLSPGNRIWSKAPVTRRLCSCSELLDCR